MGGLHLLIDITGIKVEGEGEWNARKHGGSKRRVWRKLLGQRLSAREFDRQVAEFQVRVAVLNGFTALGIPVTEAVG